MATSIDNTPWMEWIEALGGTSRQSYAAAFPPSRYFCLPDDLPLHLIPRRSSPAASVRRERPSFLNPECLVCPAQHPPDELRDREDLFSGFALQGTIAWVRDPMTRNLLPFWLGPQLEEIVRNLKLDEPVPDSVSDDARALLMDAGIIVRAEHRQLRMQHWNDTLAKAGPLFRQKGYAPLGGLIHPFHVAALRRYYRYLIRTGAIQLGDGQSPRRYVAYNEPVARFFHHEIAARLSAVAGEPLRPSYVYFASYLSGAELRKHTDRPQCEFSVTLCLDFSPEPALETPWPIQLDTAAGSVAVYQALGDGLAYRGTRLPHYRDRLRQGCTSSSIFFHYVPADFTGSLD